MTTAALPGVHVEDVFPPPAPVFRTGVPAFLGHAGPLALSRRLEAGDPFDAPDGALGHAVRGFFDNGGQVCHVVPLTLTGTVPERLAALAGALALLDAADQDGEVDLVCAPDLMPGPDADPRLDAAAVVRLQHALLRHCMDRGDRFAILDAVPAGAGGVLDQRAALASLAEEAENGYGALYHPWLRTGAAVAGVPPCGHVAGVYARCDGRDGVHKAPANELVDGFHDLRTPPSGDEVAALYARGVNCVHAVPGRGIRVWGARTLSDDDPWRDVSARRVFVTLTRWIARFLAGLAFEPNDLHLWLRITRELSEYLAGQFDRGALRGRSAAEAFFVRCDRETNPPEMVAAGVVTTHVGLAVNRPAEFIQVRIHHGPSGVTVKAA